MSSSEAQREYFFVSPIMADSTGKVAGAALAASTTAAAVDLASMQGLPATWPTTSANANPNPLGHFLDVTAQAGDVYVVFGPTLASVTGANAPVPATVNTLTSNVPNYIAGICDYVPSGSTKRFKLWQGGGAVSGAIGANSPCRFMAYVTASGTATLRIHQSSH